jgi:hypothetical protein
MRKTHLIGVSLFVSFASASGCSEDLGKCNEDEARRLIIDGEGRVLYAGQAILNQACAAGQCHASSATGELRQGAPKSLDFELVPAGLAKAGEASVQSGKPPLGLNAKAIAKLRKNQRVVFDNRELIWTQIVDGLMPPDGVGQSYREKAPGSEADPTMPCQKKEALGSITSSDSRKILRNWLACGSPVVETANEEISESVLTATPAGVPGTVGQQMPICFDPATCDDPITIDQVHELVFVPSCVSGCHEPGGAYSPFDLSTVEKSYAALMTDSPACEVPFVVQNDAKNSYIVTKMGGESDLEICSGNLMPLGASEPLDCAVRRVAAWINAGAPEPGAPAPGADAGM